MCSLSACHSPWDLWQHKKEGCCCCCWLRLLLLLLPPPLLQLRSMQVLREPACCYTDAHTNDRVEVGVITAWRLPAALSTAQHSTARGSRQQGVSRGGALTHHHRTPHSVQ